MKRLYDIGIYLGIAQCLFGLVCAYMVAAINDDVWHGLKLDDLAFTGIGAGFGMVFLSGMMKDISRD